VGASVDESKRTGSTNSSAVWTLRRGSDTDHLLDDRALRRDPFFAR
jgi:hypothetical protein